MVEGSKYEGSGTVIKGDTGFATLHNTEYYLYNDQDTTQDCALWGEKYTLRDYETKRVQVKGTVKFTARLPVVEVEELRIIQEDKGPLLRPRTP